MRKKAVQTDIEPEHDVTIDNAKMFEIAQNHLAAQSPTNEPELSLMRVFLNLINKGFDKREVADLILSLARDKGIAK